MELTNETLVAVLVDEGVLQTPHIIQAFESIDRSDFVPEVYIGEEYEDRPLPIPGGQTISQPYTVAFMLELLQPTEADRVLDLGSGSGWTTALLAHVVGHNGRVIGVEIVPELVAFGQENLAKYSYEHADIRAASSELGLPKEAPFTKILVSATANQLSESLVAQLAVGGVMVAPIGNALWRVTKTATGELEIEKYEGFAFVPLIT